MKKIDEIDKNLKVETELSEKNIKFYDVKGEPFDLYGFYKAEPNERFLRLPEETAKNTNEGVEALCGNTAGGRVRFKTDSRYVAISVKYAGLTRFSHMPLTGTAGFDMYIFENNKYNYAKTFIPPSSVSEKGFESIHYFDNEKLKDITINFPLYSGVMELYIGVEEGSVLTGGEKYINEKPIVYYGSSITQGGCASRPGNSYQGIVSRYFNCDYINLGFSGNARGERTIAEYISGLEMSCFVYDYDHNAPVAEHLAKTHKPMFDLIRKNNPNLPIIIMTAPLCTLWDEKTRVERNRIIRNTYIEAKNSGDENVYFIDGEKMFDIFGGDGGTVDGCHPNDMGFMCMARCIIEELKKIFN